MSRINIFIFVFLFSSCTIYKTVNFSTTTFVSNSKVVNFKLKIPRDKIVATNSNLKTNLLKEWKYSDGSVLYISIDINYTDSPNYENWIKCSDYKKGDKCIEGKQLDGKHWKEVTSNDLVIGYYNVNTVRKSEFDNSLNSMMKRK